MPSATMSIFGAHQWNVQEVIFIKLNENSFLTKCVNITFIFYYYLLFNICMKKYNKQYI